jgi:hypothetical protein
LDVGLETKRVAEEIERLGAFARGAHRVTGWRRTIAVVVVLPILVTFVAFVVNLARLLADVIRFVF